MDENMSDEDNRDKTTDSPEKAKRLKTDPGSIEKSEESSSSSNNTEQESASVSTDSGFPRSRNSRNRSYRIRSTTEHSGNRSDDEDSAMVETESPGDMSLYSSNSDSTVIVETDTETDTESEKEHPVLKKPKPKHSWFIVPEILNRQIGYTSNLQSSELFMRRCYGSLHCVQRLELMYKLEQHDGCVNSLNFHPEGHLLASGSDDLKVVIWDWKIGKCLLSYDTKHRGNVFQSKFLNLSGDLHIATCARDGQVRIAQVSVEEGVRANRKLGSHRGPCHKLALLTEQPHILLSAGEDGLVLSHDVRKNKPERIVNVKDDDREVALYSIHGHPLKTQEFCVSGRDHIVRVYDQRKSDVPLSTYHPFRRNQTTECVGLHVTCAVYNHNGSQILASYNDADIYLFDVNSEPGTFIHQYQGHRNGATIKGVNFFGPKSEFIVSGSDCGNVYFWEKNTEAIIQWMLADDNGVVNCLEPHPWLPFICTSGLDWDIKVWVPSCETDPVMKHLNETLRDNSKSRANWSSYSGDINESQMLWMLWSHLRRSRMRRVISGDAENILLQINSNTSSSSSSSSGNTSNDEDDDLDGPTGCSAS